MKKIFLMFIILLLCGCNVNYDIYIDEDKISENISFEESNLTNVDQENDAGWTVRGMFESFTSNEFVKEDYTYETSSDGDILSANAKSDNIDLADSKIFNQCYSNFKIEEKDGVITINSGSEFTCYDLYSNLDTITVNIKTNNKVISSNCDIEEDGKYIWNITKDGNKEIEISYEVVDKDKYNTYYIIGGILLFIILIVYIIYSKFNKKDLI